MRLLLPTMACLSLAGALGAPAAAAGENDEFRVKREEVFEFAEKPSVVRQGDRVTVSFASKGRCDATVAVEDGEGRIVRHLASGVLGPRAPAPFQKDSLKQTLVWDGKDDQGEYVDDKAALTVRVSLGLAPRFERTLFWSPKKRIAPGHRPLFASAPEGVYVFEGGGVDHLRLFDHAGNYLRTIYPFPPDYTSAEARSGSPKALQAALSGVRGLKWDEFPQDGRLFPHWWGLMSSTMLTSGDNANWERSPAGAMINPTKYGNAASAMALQPAGERGGPGRLALIKRYLDRLATDGTTGGLPLTGPKTMTEQPGKGNEVFESYPISAAFSPDGKRLYLTGFVGKGYGSFLPAVMQMSYEGDDPPKLFAGSMKEVGTDDAHFRDPLWVACDSRGRVYVADYMNDRIQVFTPDGKLYKSVPVAKPLRVFVHPKTGHIYTASWLVLTRHLPSDAKMDKPVYVHLGPVDDPKPIATYPLELSRYASGVFMNRTSWTHDLFVDFHTEPPTVWLIPGSGDTTEKLLQLRRTFAPGMWQASPWAESHYRLYVEKDGKLVEKANFAKDVAEAVTRVSPPGTPAHERQRLYVNPRDGSLYVMEGDGGVGKSTIELLRIDPDTGKVATLRLPYHAEEIGFDLNGLLYLRTDIAVGRYDPRTLREVPWDYGEEMTNPGFDGDGGKAVAVLPMPGTGKPGQFHLGGFGVSPTGKIVVSCYDAKPLELVTDGFDSRRERKPRAYQPTLFPGRLRYAEVHVWDKYGKLSHQDAVPGLPLTDGLFIDRDDNVYALVAARRLLDGKPYPLITAETLMKFKPGQAKVLSSGKVDIPLPKEAAPQRPPDIDMCSGGPSWVEGAEWLYGGVGLGGFNPNWAPNCACWNARFALDLYARSFVTELGRSCVAVLDTEGNLIMRLGKYGNVDDGAPLVKAGGPENPRPVGGDEVALARPGYVAAHTDRRLFIADYGNYRILSVKLGYHATEKVRLAEVPDAGGKR